MKIERILRPLNDQFCQTWRQASCLTITRAIQGAFWLGVSWLTYVPSLIGRVTIEAFANCFYDIKLKYTKIAIARFISDKVPEDQKNDVRTIINLVPEDRQLDVMIRAKEFFEPQMNGSQKAEIICCMAAVSEEQWADVKARAEKYFEPQMNGSQKAQIIYFMALVSEKQWADATTRAHEFFEPRMGGLEKAKLIYAIAQVSQEQWAYARSRAQEFFLTEMVVTAKAGLIIVIAGLSEEQWEYVRGLVALETDGVKKLCIIRNIGSVPQERWADVRTRAEEFFEPQMGGFEKAKLIYAIAQVSQEQWAYVMELVTPEMEQFNKARIICNIGSVPQEGWADVIDNASRLFTPQMSGRVKALLIRFIAPVSQEQRADVITRAQALFDSGMFGFEKAQIIQVIAEVPQEQRDDVITRAEELFDSQTRGFDKIRIIDAIANVPQAQREDVIAYARALFTRQMQGWEKGNRIRTIANVPQEQRAAFVDELTRGGLIHLAQAGVNVHVEQRDQRLKEAVSLLRAHQGAIEQDRLHDAVEAFKEYLGGRPNSSRKDLAQGALLTPKQETEDFGPLLSGADEAFTILGLKVTGKEIIGRLWLYASTLQDPEQTNAKEGIITGLAGSFDEVSGRVCNQGKTQRLFVSVLQGRLEGVAIDRVDATQISTHVALRMFFTKSERQAIEDPAQLLFDEAYQFCQENPQVNRNDFLLGILDYARESGFE